MHDRTLYKIVCSDHPASISENDHGHQASEESRRSWPVPGENQAAGESDVCDGPARDD
jgi:hypothetical protein